jgi:hypothetical protein
MNYTLLTEMAAGCVALLVFCAWRALRNRSRNASYYQRKRWFDFR